MSDGFPTRLRPGQRWRRALVEALECFRMALGALVAHKLRSGLTLLGILVGVFSIIVVMTAMRVVRSNIENELRSFGGQTFVVQKWPGIHFGGGQEWEKIRRREEITYADAERIREQAGLAVAVGSEMWVWSGELVSPYGRTPPTVQIRGVTPGSFSTRNWTVGEGRVFGEGDLEGGRDVCVLGFSVATTLFPYSSALGERVRADGIPYQVVGVLEPPGNLRGGEGDNHVLVPMTTAIDRYSGRRRGVTVFVQARDARVYDETVEQVRGILRNLRKVQPGDEDDFEIFSGESLMEEIENLTAMVRWGVAAVSSIALLAAGVGIMNIMLVSVTERTREIGIRRAVGARRRSILLQFLMEAVVLCQVGGLFGVIFGILGGNALAILLEVPAVLPLDWAVAGLVICSVVGIAFGTYPAMKAANLDPIEALHHE